MSTINGVSDGTNKFSSFEVNLVESNIGNPIKVSLDNERAFYGTLEGYDEHWLYLRNNGKPILIKRRKISSLVVV